MGLFRLSVERTFDQLTCVATTLSAIMQNEAGEYVDLYIPRKCSASNRTSARVITPPSRSTSRRLMRRLGEWSELASTRRTPSAVRSAEWARATTVSCVSPRKTACSLDHHLAKKDDMLA